MTRKVFVGASSEYRSESDTGHYVALAQAAVRDYKVFTRFRRHPDYMVVLEHVTQQEGASLPRHPAQGRSRLPRPDRGVQVQ